MKPCRFCGDPTENPDALCSNKCREEVFGETNAELYEDSRKSYLDTDDEATDETEESLED